MKILEVNKYYPPWIGGIETVVKQVAEGFSDRGQQVTVLCCSGSNDEKIESQGGVLIIRVQRFFLCLGCQYPFLSFDGIDGWSGL